MTQHGIYANRTDIDSDDDDDDEDSTQAAAITEEQRCNLRHEGIAVPRHANPFATEEETDGFLNMVAHAIQIDAELEGFGAELAVRSDYPTVERITLGQGGRREIEIPLTMTLWLPRIRSWCQAASLLHMYREYHASN